MSVLASGSEEGAEQRAAEASPINSIMETETPPHTMTNYQLLRELFLEK